MRDLIRWARLALKPGAVMTIVLATAACGPSQADHVAVPSQTSEEAGGATTTTTPDAAESGSSKSSTKSEPGAPTSTTTPTPKAGERAVAGATSPSVPVNDTSRTLDIAARLNESCVRPGGSQTITITARPASGVGFDAVYSDGKSGLMEGHYGGNFGGFTDPDGSFVSTWVVAPNAPAGQVLVRVLGTHEEDGLGQTSARFSVADALGNCA